MAMKKFAAGSIIYEAGQPISSYDVIISGSVTVAPENSDILLEKGDVLGVIDSYRGIYENTYTADSDTTIIIYPYNGPLSIVDMLKANKDLSIILFTSTCKQLCNILKDYSQCNKNAELLYSFLEDDYKKYKALCIQNKLQAKSLPTIEELVPMVSEERIDPWLFPYYESMRALSKDDLKTFFAERYDLCAGTLLKASQDMSSIKQLHTYSVDYFNFLSELLLNENGLDFFDLYTDLYYRILQKGEESPIVLSMIEKIIDFMENNEAIEADLFYKRTDEFREFILQIPKERELKLQNTFQGESAISLQDSLDVILSYADCPKDTNINFKKYITEYKKLEDKSSTEDFAISLRKKITVLFHEIYNSAFVISIQDKNIPTILKMFFLFGYVDEELAGIQNACYLYGIANDFHGNSEYGVYTFYEWLMAIYKGDKEPCRNEFDVDYGAYVHDLKLHNKIDAKMEELMLSDMAQKVDYELNNMFTNVNKITFGQISNYCPVLSESNILKSLEHSQLSASAIKENLDRIRQLDYSAYYREMLYANTDLGINKEMIQVEILPDFILMPGIGTRGVMWQEIEGKRRTTPSRMMLPVFYMPDLFEAITRLTGEFRWEMCKRVQGARWNDAAEHSLTSDYFDYLQFYRKNNELSPDTKEKIRLSLIRSKNSFKESFVRDYIIWIVFESSGSPRLNKSVRSVLLTHCPFSANLIQSLKNNPMYTESITHYETKRLQKLHHYELILQKAKNLNKKVPQEIIEQIEFIKS